MVVWFVYVGKKMESTQIQYNTIQYSLFNEGDVITQ